MRVGEMEEGVLREGEGRKEMGEGGGRGEEEMR